MANPEPPYCTWDSSSTESSNVSTKKPQKTKKPPRSRPESKSQSLSFSEKLGRSLAAGLVKEKIPVDSLDLVDRLAFARFVTAKTTTTRTRNSIVSTVIEKEETLVFCSEVDEATNALIRESTTPRKAPRLVFDLNDFHALAALEELIAKYGRVSHMGILDSSYTFFITEDRKAALYYKVKDKIAVVGGDPLCDSSLFPQILSEFKAYRKKHSWGIAFLGAGETFVAYAREQKYTTMCFGVERVLNPMTNPVLHSNAGKSITRTAKNLSDPKKEGIVLLTYTPRQGKNVELQQQLVKVYKEWRDQRNESKKPQAYITVYDPFALPELMTYIYAVDPFGTPVGFAALRILGANKGYHLDPYVAVPSAPKGITDLLLYGTMALLNQAKITYLSLGYEPSKDLGEITGISKSMQNISRKVHRRIF